MREKALFTHEGGFFLDNAAKKSEQNLCFNSGFFFKKNGFIALIKMEALPQRVHEKTERTEIRLLNAAMRRT